MDEVITTIYYDGQFWAALVEKISPDGTIHIGRHVFGPEPTHNDIRNFYMNSYDTLPLRRAEHRFRIKERRTREEQDRTFGKSLVLYQECRTEYLKEHKKTVREQRRLNEQEKFRWKQQRKKQKKRGK